jgi:hypothetical protein
MLLTSRMGPRGGDLTKASAFAAVLVSALAGASCGSDSRTADSDANLSGVGAPDSIFVEDWPEKKRFPDRVRIMTATGDAAYGVWRDELDVEHIVRFQLTREQSWS